MVKKNKHKNKQNKPVIPEGQSGIEETPAEEVTEVDSIQDFIEMKRLQNRILEKIIDQISHSDHKDKKNNKLNKRI